MSRPHEAERYRRLRELFDEAHELSGEAQRAYLDAQCADTALRGEIERLLAADASEQALPGALAVGDAPALVGGMPERIGSYRIRGHLGAGGMGAVFAAEQDHPRRTVALKIMHPWLMTPALLRRFEYESEVLAQLAHPGIAHIYEAGTAEVGGSTLPYFAMEFVQGVPITRFADERGLSLHDRLALVARVADAVEHAHRIGVIHRDLKPQNILVDGTGQPKILDFGIARAVQSDERSNALRTQSGLLVGTLAYMSPEQAGGDRRALDTRSDVYALGVLAYELIAGRLPYDVSNTTLARAAQIITENEPARLGALDRRLRGDVETIVSKALEKDRQRRYPSAAALASDVRAFLQNQPISARRATTIYQVVKFARRHTGLVTGLAATFVALVAGLVVSLVYYAKSETAREAAELSGAAEVSERQRAERSALRADSINTFVLQEMFAAPDPWTPAGKDVTVASTLDRIAGKVRTSFAHDPELEADAHATLAGSYLARGLFDRGAFHAERALELRLALRATDSRDLASSLLTLARVRAELGNLAAAEAHACQALEMYARLPDAPRETLADATRHLAKIQLSRGEHQAALESCEHSLAEQRALHGETHAAVAEALSDLVAVHVTMGRADEAERFAREALAMRRRLHPDSSPFVALALTDLATPLFEKNDEGLNGEIVALNEESATILLRSLGPEHRLTLLARRGLANALVRLERFDEAERILREVTEALPRVIGIEHEDYVQTLNSHGYLLFTMGRLDEAEEPYTRAIELGEKFFGDAHENTLRPLVNLAYLEVQRGQDLARAVQGTQPVDATTDLARAEQHFRRALSGLRSLYGEHHESVRTVLVGLGGVLEQAGNHREAAEVFAAHVSALTHAQPAGYEQTITRSRMREGVARMRAGEEQAAEEVLRDAVERCRKVFPAGDWRTAMCTGALGECLTRRAKLGEAEPLLLESLAALEPRRAQNQKDFQNALRRLAELNEQLGRPDRAREYRARL